MFRLQGGKRKKKTKFYTAIVLVVTVIMIIILARPTWKIFQKYLFVKGQFKEVEREFRELEKREKQLLADLAEIQSRSGQEREIIRKFDMIRDGEGLVVILEPELPNVEPEPEKNFFQKYFGWFKFDGD